MKLGIQDTNMLNNPNSSFDTFAISSKFASSSSLKAVSLEILLQLSMLNQLVDSAGVRASFVSLLRVLYSLVFDLSFE